MHRYKFFSALHKDRVILILKNGNYYSYGNNAKILNYIGFKGNTKKLIDKEISYMVIENLDVVDSNIYNNNNYERYIILCKLREVLDNIKDNLYNKSMEDLDAI